MRRDRAPRIWSAVVLLAAWASPAATFAVDKNLLPGSACLAEDGAQQIDMEYPKGWIENAAGSARSFVCPIIRDTVAAPDVTVDVRLHLASYGNWDCTLECCPNTGGDCANYDPASGQAGLYGGYTTITLGPVDTYTDGHCDLRCEVDPGGGVVWYEWQDNGTYYLEDDAKVYGGDWCIGEDSDNDDVVHVGVLWTATDTAQNVICPIMRDNTDSTTGLSALWAEIYWPAGGAGISCTYYAKNSSNTVLDSGLDSTSYHGECSDGAGCVLSWDTADYDESGDPGYSYLACYLNAGDTAEIISYKAREN
ncbi:MAG: hypothetical protein HYY06_04340 [Deltaproteobacteria bacterium]|nr:hypothetical protein [Deltaproteobacteria bacterium]